MTRKKQLPHVIDSVAAMHRAFDLPKPGHPLVSVINFENVKFTVSDVWDHFVVNLYCVAIKKGIKGRMKYGQTNYDFDEGVMTFTAPNQVMSLTNTDEIAMSGYLLYFHPDFLKGYPLMKTIRDYDFFSYELHEALLLSTKEEEAMIRIMKDVELEYHASIDRFSQDVIISHIELLLVYANRFYNRQFITRKNLNQDVLSKLEALLNEYFNGDKVKEMGLPTVKYISDQLNISPGYLGDLLRNLTGVTTQQHIHDKVIEKAKEILSTTSLSVSEIAYQLGFEYPQSFNKLFKNKTHLSPLKYRQTFN